MWMVESRDEPEVFDRTGPADHAVADEPGRLVVPLGVEVIVEDNGRSVLENRISAGLPHP
jgi:hypothetical protein